MHFKAYTDLRGLAPEYDSRDERHHLPLEKSKLLSPSCQLWMTIKGIILVRFNERQHVGKG
jgi:hypothetical protein